MSEQFLIKHASPTLAGIKTGNMFTVRFEKGSDIYSIVRGWNAILTKKGLRVIPLKKTAASALIYVYRPGNLRRDLSDPRAVSILKDKGYNMEKKECLIPQLIRHLSEDDTFPHEIGLFLGYPPSDVLCFMNNPCDGVKCSGCWKAYSDAEDAEKTFSRYRKCTDVYTRLYNNGRSLSQLTVASSF